MSAVSTAKRARLGKGLGALLGEYLPQQGESAPEEGVLRMVPVGALRPNPFQPRREFAPEQLAELEAAIRENGLLQPLIVRAIPDPRRTRRSGSWLPASGGSA